MLLIDNKCPSGEISYLIGPRSRGCAFSLENNVQGLEASVRHSLAPAASRHLCHPRFDAWQAPSTASILSRALGCAFGSRRPRGRRLPRSLALAPTGIEPASRHDYQPSARLQRPCQLRSASCTRRCIRWEVLSPPTRTKRPGEGSTCAHALQAPE